MSSKNAVDLFGLLPDYILEDIFFRLPWDDAAHMTAMSKAWSNIWGSLPVHSLEFNFGQKLSDIDERFEDVANGKAIIKKFRLSVKVTDPKIASCVDRWLELAVKNFVGELDIEIWLMMEINLYRLPYTTLLAKPMQVLRLRGCKLEQPLYDDNVKYTYLRELYLSNVQVDDAVFMDLMHRCSALEDLSISNCIGLKSLLIPPLPKLEKLIVYPPPNYVSGFEKINIEAVNLKSFHYEAWPGSEISETLGICVDNWSHLTALTIKSTNLSESLLECLLHKLPLLQDLTLSRCFKIQHRVKISHSSLRRLFLDPCCELEQLEIETPNLLVFEYDNICFAKLFTLNAPSLKESCLRITPHANLTTNSFLRLRRHISNFDQLNVLAISFWQMDVKIFFKSSLLENLNEFENHPIPVVKHLELPIVHEGLNYEAILNGLFWTCHPESLIVYRGGSTHNSSFTKFLREKLLNRDEDDVCCDSGGIRCWRHFLKDVVMEKIRGDQVPVLRFYLKW